MWSWWKNLVPNSKRSAGRGRRERRKRRRSVLQIELLEDRTTPAPVTATQAFASPGASNPFANETTTFTGAITPNVLPPVIVNSLDQSTLQMEAAGTFGLTAGLSAFPNFQTLLLQDPNLDTNVSDGVPALQFFPTFFPGASFSSGGEVFQIVEVVTTDQLPTAQEHILLFTERLVPTTLRNPLS